MSTAGGEVKRIRSYPMLTLSGSVVGWVEVEEETLKKLSREEIAAYVGIWLTDEAIASLQ